MIMQMKILSGPAELVEYVNKNHIKRENIQYIKTYGNKETYLENVLTKEA